MLYASARNIKKIEQSRKMYFCQWYCNKIGSHLEYNVLLGKFDTDTILRYFIGVLNSTKYA